MVFGLFEPHVLLTFLGAGIVLNLTPGADVAFTMASGLKGGKRSGIAAAIGITTGSLVHTVLAAFGLAAVLISYPIAFDAIRYLGAAYLLYLAWQAWTQTGSQSKSEGASSMRQAIAQGFLTNILNPKVALFILAFLPQFTNPQNGPVWLQMLILGGLFSSTGIIVTIAYGLLAGTLSDKLHSYQRPFNKITALIFGGLAARLAWQ
ncbi:MAG: LysE family translocator [Marinovum sp.]|nr:LysE family translocator [Marinovum sp.]MBT6098119.1 LysE family translocator [Marinovum sp.]